LSSQKIKTVAERIVIIPTYNEKENIERIIRKVFSLEMEFDILVVEDNSPDGTAEIVRSLMSEFPGRLHMEERKGKLGLGTAYIHGFKWALAHGYGYIFEMDADFSHDPSELPNFITAANQGGDLVLGSRYMHGIRITNWPLSRLLLSKSAATYVRIVTGMPVTDPTGGFKCYRRKVLETINLDGIVSNGYSFQVEMSHTVWMSGFRIREIPITFVDRRSGYSKMSTAIFKEALWIVWKLLFRNGLRRSPRVASAG